MKEMFVLLMFFTGLIWWSLLSARGLFYLYIVIRVELTPQDKFIDDALRRMRKPIDED